MTFLMIALYLIGGTLILSWGAHLFVGSASHMAKRLGVPSIVIGLTVVAFGTSAPEFAVNIIASLKGNPGIAMGNVVGSNIFNITIILGICAIISPLAVSMQLIKIDIPIMIVTSFILWLMTRDMDINRFEGLILATGLIAYNVLQVKLAMKERASIKKEFEDEYAGKGTPWKNGLMMIGGLGLLVAGADLFVTGAVQGARLLGWSESLIGLTIIAAGTSLPEVATSVAATLKGERDIAIGNVVGSNLFNMLGVLGFSGSIVSLPVDDHMARIDILVMLTVTFLVLPFTIRKKILGRAGGILFVAVWLGYTGYLIMNAKAM